MGARASAFNPLVPLLLGLAGIVCVSLSASVYEAAAILIVFGALASVLGLKLTGGLNATRIMLPWALAFFAVHVGFTQLASNNTALAQTAQTESVVLARLMGLTLILGTVRNGLTAQGLIDSLKTMLDRLNIRSRWAEDFLQTVSLTLAFIPHVQTEYTELARFHRALGFTPPSTFRQRITYYGSHLVPVLSRSLDRAQQVGAVMALRRYGQVIPRGQLTPEIFTWRDGLAVAGTTILLGAVLWLM